MTAWPGPSGRAAAITGLGVHRPARIVDSAEIAARLGVTAAWIESRTGISTRRHAGPDETLAAMAVAAARRALHGAGITPGDVGLVLAASSSNVRIVPGVAPAVAEELGAVRAGACDLNAACAGFAFGLAHAVGHIAAGTARHVLVVATERLSDITDPDDPGTAFLFGDGAGAAVVSAADTPGIGPVVTGHDGAAEHLLTLAPDLAALGPGRPRPYLTMQGVPLAQRVVRLARDAVPRTLAATGVGWDTITAFVPHQANLRLNRMCAAALGVPDHVVLADAVTVDGNTSSASIPLALDHLLAGGRAKPGDTALLLGHGAGLTWASMVLRLPEYQP